MIKKVLKTATLSAILGTYLFGVDAIDPKTVSVVGDDALTYKSFSGMLPCASCEGIKESIAFGKDGTFRQNSIYMDSKNIDVFTKTGTYTIKKNKVTLTDVSGEKTYYQLKNNSLIMLDQDGNLPRGELANNYVLNYIDYSYYDQYYNYFVKEEKKSNTSVTVTYANGVNNVSLASEVLKGKQNCKFNGVGLLEAGGVYASNGKEYLTITMLDDNRALVDGSAGICKKGSVNGIYKISNDMPKGAGLNMSNFTITKNAIGNITKDMTLEQIKAQNPNFKFKEKKGNKYIVQDPNGIKLFEFHYKNNKIRNIRVFSKSYQTPEGVSIATPFGEINKAIKIDKVWVQGAAIFAENTDYGIVFSFLQSDLLPGGIDVYSIKETAKPTFMFINW